MFTGLIHHIGTITEATGSKDVTLTVACDLGPEPLRIGESIACNGACLTVVSYDAKSFVVQLSGETLTRTAPRWKVGRKLHLERSLKMDDRLDGHLVTGHIDGLAAIRTIQPAGDSHILTLEAPEALQRFIAEKGSVTLDGISLTVNTIKNNHFTVNIIAHTWQATTLHERVAGDSLNLEIDLIARYVARLLPT